MRLIYSDFVEGLEPVVFVSPFVIADNDGASANTAHQALHVRRSLLKYLRKMSLLRGQYVIDINSTRWDSSLFGDDAPTIIIYSGAVLNMDRSTSGEFGCSYNLFRLY